MHIVYSVVGEDTVYTPKTSFIFLLVLFTSPAVGYFKIDCIQPVHGKTFLCLLFLLSESIEVGSGKVRGWFGLLIKTTFLGKGLKLDLWSKMLSVENWGLGKMAVVSACV